MSCLKVTVVLYIILYRLFCKYVLRYAGSPRTTLYKGIKNDMVTKIKYIPQGKFFVPTLKNLSKLNANLQSLSLEHGRGASKILTIPGKKSYATQIIGIGKPPAIQVNPDVVSMGYVAAGSTIEKEVRLVNSSDHAVYYYVEVETVF
jgi:hypothetical protein